nr:twin-arginine translocation signal domain-containing protein [Deltaproteobacteria bacterium]
MRDKIKKETTKKLSRRKFLKKATVAG